MNTASAGTNLKADGIRGDLRVVDAVLAPHSRARFFNLLGLRLSIDGIDTIGRTESTAGGNEDDTVREVLHGLAGAINTRLDASETVVAFFRDTKARRCVAGSSSVVDQDGMASILTGIGKRIEMGFSPVSGECMRIDSETGEYVGSVFEKPGTVLVSAIFARDRVVGLAGIAGADGKSLNAGVEASLMLTTVLIGRVMEEMVGNDETEERMGSLAHALCEALDARVPNGKGHSYRVAMYSMVIFNEMDHAEGDPAYQDLRHRLRLAALLHDIGKVAVPESIIGNDELSDEDLETLRRHPVAGAEILARCYGLRDVVPGVLYHHERFDGSGYPFNLAGSNIPISARIIALADAFDRMTADGYLGKMVSHDEAIEILKSDLSARFDPAILYALSKAHEDGVLRHVRLHSEVTRSAEGTDVEVEAVYGGQLKSIPPLPQVLSAVNSLLDDPGASLKEVADMLSTDQGLAARVLKLVNSSYYGLPRTVSTIALATTMLGVRTLKNHVVNLAYADLMSGLAPSCQAYDQIWQHALKTAAWARAISSLRTEVDPEEAFTAGLLHDIGKMVCLRLKPEEYGRVVLESERHGSPLIGLEEDVVGFDHMRIGAWAASHWKLPEVLVSSIRWHHHPEYLDDDCESVYYAVRVVHLADIAAMGGGKEGADFTDFVVRELSPEVLTEIGRDHLDELTGMKADVDEGERALKEAFAGLGSVHRDRMAVGRNQSLLNGVG
jgi:putative nucleotidyltransferase with HDIG domain